MSAVEELAVAPALGPPTDAVGLVIGSGHYIQNQRLGDLHISTPMGKSPRLRVSRYYWDLEPPIAVDFVRSLGWGELELAAKKAYCRAHGIRYILVKDSWDDEGAERALLEWEPDGETTKAVKNAAKPLIGPRRRRV